MLIAFLVLGGFVVVVLNKSHAELTEAEKSGIEFEALLKTTKQRDGSESGSLAIWKSRRIRKKV